MPASEQPGPVSPPVAASGAQSIWARVRTSKPQLFSLLGFLGGAGGELLTEILSLQSSNNSAPPTMLGLIFHTALWTGTFSAVLSATLAVAEETHHRRKLSPRAIRRPLLLGALSGAVAGGIAQASYSFPLGPAWFHQVVVRTLCWGLMGGLLGMLLSAAVPNFGWRRGGLAGLAGGVVGGIGFLVVGVVFPIALARVIGVGLLGLALGLAMVLVEKFFREASLEVIWAPGETTKFNLGAQAVSIGGGEDHVFVRGLPPRFASLAFTNGLIEYVETATGKRTPLKDGSRLEIGKLNLVIHAAK